MRLHQRLRREQGRHTDDWLITYADTITLLLCLFVIILSVRAGGKSLAHEGAPPVLQAAVSESIFAGNSPFHPLTCGAEGAFAVSAVLSPEPEAESPGPEKVAPPPIVARPDPVRVTLPAIIDHPRPQITVPAVVQGGDRITTLQIGSTAFFGSGNATISSAGKAFLSDVATTLKSGELAAYRIAVEGHTDDTPINTVQFQSNWELSTARAAAVVHFFLEQGIPARKLTAAGYADTLPIAPNRNDDGTVIPENQAKNRRVVIRLEKIDKSE
jgi:chemotaxis protein MotB